MSQRIAVAFSFAWAFLAVPSKGVALPTPANPIVRFDTTLGSFQVELFASEAPLTVANFLNYVTSGRYDESVIHRSSPGFVIQGGGYTFPSEAQGFTPIPTFPPVVNESGNSNIRGTIAMATLFGDPNGARSQWFFNLANNSALDTINGGYTVFGEVLDNGMNVVDAIAALPRLRGDGAFTEVPTINFQGGSLLKEHLVFVGVQIVPEPSGAALIALGLTAVRRRAVPRKLA